MFGTVVPTTYQGFMAVASRWTETLMSVLWPILHQRMAEIGGRFWRVGQWVPIAFDGSRSSAPRTRANEAALCAKNYGKGKTAKYRKKKSKGLLAHQCSGRRAALGHADAQVVQTAVGHRSRIPRTQADLGPGEASLLILRCRHAIWVRAEHQRCQRQSDPVSSPPARLERAARTVIGMVAPRNRTEPSANSPFAPPGCME
jgi:hypothetical protein